MNFNTVSTTCAEGWSAPVAHRAATAARMSAARGLFREKSCLEAEVRTGTLPAAIQAGLRRRASQAGRKARTLLLDVGR